MPTTIAQPQSERHDIDKTAIERVQEDQTQCANVHTVAVLYAG
jgi:hypothetical protein